MRRDSIIFDLDGTLWDSAKPVTEAWNITLQDFPEINKVLVIEDIQGIMGLVVEEIAVKLFPEVSKEKGIEIVNRCCTEQCDYLSKVGGKLYDDLENILEKLSKNYDLFIVSNCQGGYIEAFFEAHGLGKYFKDILCSGTTGLKKGHNIKIIIEKNQLKAPVYVGDTRSDYEATKIAGVPFIYASYGFGKVEGEVTTISKIEDLLELL